MELYSAVKVFEQVEKLRKSQQIRLSHLARNMACRECLSEWMPTRREPCPKCKSEHTRIMKTNSKCLDCGEVWRPKGIDQCPNCGSPDIFNKPRRDQYIEEKVLPRLVLQEEQLETELRDCIISHPTWAWASKVKGVGPTSLARILGGTDITRCSTVSKFWSHCGFGLNGDGTVQRRKKGEKITYDPQLKSACVMLGENLLRAGGSYYAFYLEKKEERQRKEPDITNLHLHNHAYRIMIKLFLSHLWEVWRTSIGLPAPKPFVFVVLNHDSSHYIPAESMTKSRKEITNSEKGTA